MQLVPEQTQDDEISDSVFAAMETGNAARAREILAEKIQDFPETVKRLHREVFLEYGIHL